MKKILLLLTLVLITATTVAQAPSKISYQSVIRDSKGALITNKKITVQISVLKAAKDGEAVYVETHETTTNTNGLVSIEIGGGAAEKGKFDAINWADGSYFIKTATDPNGGSHYDIVGVSEILSVPYALNARTAQNSFSGNYKELTNKPTKISEFINDVGFITNQPINSQLVRPMNGVPSQNWSLFGNSNSNATLDKLGTTDFMDLVIVTNNLDRLRIQANGDIKLRKSLEVGEDLTVNRNVYLNVLGGNTTNNGNFTVANAKATSLTGILTVDGATNLNNLLNVNNGSPTHLTGLLDVDTTLNVDGATTLQSTLDVQNGAASHLTGALDVDTTLNVDGVSNLNSALNVNNGAASHLTGLLDVDTTLNVDGATTLQSTLNVNNGAASHLTGALDVDTTLNVDGATTLQSTLNANGQVTISTNVGGGEGSYGAYPLRVQGSDQGVAIKLNAGTPNNSNNFITFFNGSGGAVGRIEGQNATEALTDPEYIFDNAILLAEEIKAGVNVGTSFTPVVVAGVGASAGPCGACIAAAAADLVLASANLIAYNVFALENLGVTYQSGSADYAEWLEKSNPSERITAGDIVGVNSGKISKLTTNARQFMVISTKPAMLGNMPMDGNEKSYEKVAFMGQIPVKVKGIVMSGDYILPSGLNDGTGIAVSPNDIKVNQYQNIVGIAWSNSYVNNGVSTINMAIGLNANDMANLAVQQEKKITALENKFNSLEQRLLAIENGTTNAPAKANTDVTSAEVKTTTTNTPSRYEMIASSMPAELSNEVMEEAIQNLKLTYEKQGITIKNHPGLNKLFTDASFKAEVIRKSQEKYRLSYQSILETAKK